jgi:hypothetical protein
MIRSVLIAAIAVATLYLAIAPANAQAGIGVYGGAGITLGGPAAGYGQQQYPPAYNGYNGNGYGYGQPQTRRFRVEHPLNVPGEYRCNANGQPANPGTGWCSR